MHKPLLIVGVFLTLFLGLSQPAFSSSQTTEPAHEPAITEPEADTSKLPELKEEEVPQAATEELPAAPTADDEASE